MKYGFAGVRHGVATAMILLFASIVHAQQLGHYVDGITGLENGSTAPPGLYIGYLPYISLIHSIKGPDGNTAVNVDLNLVDHNAVYQVTTTRKFLGASYGLGVIVPIVNTRFQANVIDKTAQTAGVSDIYFSPVTLGWEKGKFNYLLNYGFYAPTGDFNPAAPMNPGLGFWEHQIQAGTTANIDAKKLWNASVLSTWEISHSKTGLDVKTGPQASFEYSFGRRFHKYSMNAGLAGYAATKLSADSGSGINPLLRGDLDHAFAAGPEFKYTSVKHHFAFDARYERQFGVQLRTSGDVIVFSLTYLNFIIPNKK